MHVALVRWARHLRPVAGCCWAVACLPLAIAYDTILIGGGDGATPGMRLFGIEARSLNGGRPDYFQAFLMTLLFYVTVPVTSLLS